MIQSKKRIKAELKALRDVIDNSGDPIASRVAYGMECAIRWATEDTTDWDRPSQDAHVLADMLRKEL